MWFCYLIAAIRCLLGFHKWHVSRDNWTEIEGRWVPSELCMLCGLNKHTTKKGRRRMLADYAKRVEKEKPGWLSKRS